ncbi:MAG: R3H domain-containing nucleic acid-binding protein, partial [Ktedonobacteraceae bacterium]
GQTVIAEERTRDEEGGHVTARRITSVGMDVPTWGTQGFGITPRTFERDERNERERGERGERSRGGNDGWNGGGGNMRRVSSGSNGNNSERERMRARNHATAHYEIHALAPTGTAPSEMRNQHNAVAEVVTLERVIPAEEGIYIPQGQAEHVPIMKTLRVYPFGVSRDRLAESARQLHVPIIVAKTQADADAVITLKNYYRRQPDRLQEAEQDQKLIIILKNNTIAQMQHALARIFNLPTDRLPNEVEAEESDEGHDDASLDDTTKVLLETEDAIHQVLNKGLTMAELPPANAYIRRLQHQMATRYNLISRSRGKEPFRRVKIFRERD